MKKTLTSLALAGVLVAGGASAANAAQYPADPPGVTISDPTPVPGQGVTLTVQVPDGVTEVTFSVNGAPAGSTLTSMVFAAAGTVDLSVVKPVVNNTASAVFTPAGSGTFSVVVTGEGMDPITLDVVVAAAPGAPGDGTLPATGSDVPAGVIWAGVGAIGIGGIAVAAAAARRRSHSSN